VSTWNALGFLRAVRDHSGLLTGWSVDELLLAQRNPSVFEPFMRAVLRRSDFDQLVETEVMALAMREAAEVSVRPFEDLLRQTDGERLGERQLAAGTLLARVMPKALAGFEGLLREHPNRGVRHWWRERVGREAAVQTKAAPQGGVELVFIPGGTFMMGSPANEEG